MVLKYLKEYQNQDLHIADIAADLGLTNLQVSGAIASLRNTYEITSPHRGWYRFGGDNNKASKTYTLIIERGGGNLVLTDDDGTLYVARRLEV